MRCYGELIKTFELLSNMFLCVMSIHEYTLTGVMYLHDCDLERMIPIFLIVSAVNPMSFGRLGKNDDDSSGGGIICGIIGLLFSLAWLIAGILYIT